MTPVRGTKRKPGILVWSLLFNLSGAHGIPRAGAQQEREADESNWGSLLVAFACFWSSGKVISARIASDSFGWAGMSSDFGGTPARSSEATRATPAVSSEAKRGWAGFELSPNKEE